MIPISSPPCRKCKTRCCWLLEVSWMFTPSFLPAYYYFFDRAHPVPSPSQAIAFYGILNSGPKLIWLTLRISRFFLVYLEVLEQPHDTDGNVNGSIRKIKDFYASCMSPRKSATNFWDKKNKQKQSMGFTYKRIPRVWLPLRLRRKTLPSKTKFNVFVWTFCLSCYSDDELVSPSDVNRPQNWTTRILATSGICRSLLSCSRASWALGRCWCLSRETSRKITLHSSTWSGRWPLSKSTVLLIFTSRKTSAIRPSTSFRYITGRNASLMLWKTLSTFEQNKNKLV